MPSLEYITFQSTQKHEQYLCIDQHTKLTLLATSDQIIIVLLAGDFI
ncbi:hypothetical protein KGB51_gp02 [Escherichia phage C1]|uniref:Uncharacterized protein n=1 Tax=Escherichia phage C1 TaxID=2340716 RepID=A0A3G3M6U4_9CAUD|nr:hypothetical protein KGB51_gp02 [Escherichia phage C1]AYR02250.1 hypothetical protein [Escherichia phage C1]URP83755.1 hypothetical protein [Escherichia phage S192]